MKKKLIIYGALGMTMTGAMGASIVACGKSTPKGPVGPNNQNNDDPIGPADNVKINTDGVYLSNYSDLGNNITPVSKDVKYNGTYQAWKDDGFNWYQYFKTANGQGQNFGDSLFSRAGLQQNSVVQLGFITATDMVAAKEAAAGAFNKDDNPPKQAIDNQNSHSADVVPTIGGVIPLWMANWTTVNGTGPIKKGDEGWDKSYQLLNEIRSHGLDYSFSFGGWNHDSLGVDAFKKGYDALKLAELYKAVIQKLDLKTIDFDVEGTDLGRTDDHGNPGISPEDQQKVSDLRIDALNLLKKDMPSLQINFTVPSFVNNVNPISADMLVKGYEKGIIDRTNVMAFDMNYFGTNYGRISAPGESALNSISAVNSLKHLLAERGIQIFNTDEGYSKLGVVAMNGVTDVTNEITTATDAKILTSWASVKKLGAVMLWAVERDRGQQDVPADQQAGHHFDAYKISDLVKNNRSTRSDGTNYQDAYDTGMATKAYSFSSIYSQFKADGNAPFDINTMLTGDKATVPTKVQQAYTQLTGLDMKDIYNWTGEFAKAEGLTEALAMNAFTVEELIQVYTAEMAANPEVYTDASKAFLG